METGVIMFYNFDKAYGFIKIDDPILKEQYFFHLNESLYKDIHEGDKISCRIVKSINKPGKLCAVDLKLIE